MPRAVHPQVRPELEAVVEPDQQVLAERLDRGDLAADDALRPAGRRPGPPVRAAVTVRPTRYGRRPAAVRKSVSPSGTQALGVALRDAQDEAAIAGDEARLEQDRAERRDRHVLAVDLADDELADAAVGDERARGRGPR